MGGPNIIKRQSHDAAMNLWNTGQSGGYGPASLSIGGMGTLDWSGGQPTYTPGQTQQDLSNLYSGLFKNVSSGLDQMGGYASQFGGNAMGASQGLFDQLNSFDPVQAAQDRFSQLQEIIAPQQAGQRTAQQAQLLRQGRLGGTSGNAHEAQLAAAQHAADVQLANDLYGQAEQTQRNMLSDALQAGGVGAQQYSGLFNQLPQLSAGMQNVNWQPFANLLQAGTGIGQNRLQTDMGISSGINAYNSNAAGTHGASKGMWGQLAPGLIQGGLTAVGAMFGPMGAMAGNAAGQALTSGMQSPQAGTSFSAAPGMSTQLTPSSGLFDYSLTSR